MVLGTFLSAVAQILHFVLTIYTWIVIIAALCSLVQANPYNKIVQILYTLTEPLYAWIRRFVPTIFGGIDFAPFIVIIVLKFVDLFFVRILFNYAQNL
ncbi:YggT family protein [Helicobacter sp. 23-1045]